MTNRFLFEIESQTLTVPHYVFLKLYNNQSVFVVFELSEKIQCFDSSDLFKMKGCEAQYPAFLSKREIPALKEKFNIQSISEGSCEQLGVFWQYLGDATHHSEYISTPFMLKIGDNFFVSAVGYSGKIKVKVTHMDLIINDKEKWQWLLKIEPVIE